MSEAEKTVDLSKMQSQEEGWFVTGFVCCPWRKSVRPSLFDVAKWKLITPNNSNIPEDEEELDRILPIRDVKTETLAHPPQDKIQVAWIGHATVLVQFDGISILSDPVFLDYYGPLKMASVKRYRKAACRIADIPKLDAVIVSHNHIDHLEENAVKEIAHRFPDAEWFVALKQKSWLIRKGVNSGSIHELDWWKDEVIEFHGKSFRFVCTPTQHWCARAPPFDTNMCLWCSWVVQGPTKSYYFAGDTGYYDKLFKAIGDLYGPFDLAAVPIGSYDPRWILEYQHVDPLEAVKIHQDIKSKCSIGIHWGTFKTSACEFFVEPPQKVEEEMKRLDLNPHTFISLCHGETWCVGDARDTPPFMTHRQKRENC